MKNITSEFWRANFIIIGLVMLSMLTSGIGNSHENVKLLCGFEKQEVQNWDNLSNLLIFTEISQDSFKLKRLYMKEYFFIKEQASQGDYALSTLIDAKEFSFRQIMLDSNRVPDADLGDREWYIERFSDLFQEFQWFRDIFEKDWSYWDYMWIDIKSTNANAIIRVLIEDHWQASGIRKFNIPAGGYVTIKFELREVANIGGVDLTDMANFWITLEETDGPTIIYLDNIRLAKLGAVKTDGIPFITDDRPIEKRKIPIPQISSIDRPIVEKNTAPLKKAIEPTRITILNHYSTTFLGGEGDYFGRHERAISAFDNNRIIIILQGKYNNKSGLYALSTFDGGNTWKAIDSSNEPTFVGTGKNIGHRSIFEDSNKGDIFIAWMKYCYSGGGIGNANFQKLIFMGDHWILDSEIICYNHVRHCPFSFSFTRTGSERYWVAFDNWDNISTDININAVFSDDEGIIWEKQNKSPLVNVANNYSGGGIFLTPYKNEVACIWKTAWDELSWGYNDGNQWSYKGLIDNTQNTPVSVVTLQDSIIFLSIIIEDKLHTIHLEGNTWYKDLVDDGTSGRVLRSILTTSRESVYCLWAQEVGNQYNIYCRKYNIQEKKCEKSVEVVSGETDEIYNLATPVHSPTNYIPLLYDSAPLFNLNSDEYWVKFVRIPVEILTTVETDFEKNKSEAINDFLLGKNFPNPFNSSTTVPYHVKKKNQKVSLSIFNVNGQLICKLLDEYKEPGQYQAEWNGKDMNGNDLTTGVYICSLIIGHRIMNDKILLLR